MTQPLPDVPVRRGRRNTEIQHALDAEIHIAPSEEDHSEGPGESPEGQRLVFDGDICTGSATVAVLAEGDTKESYFGFKHTTHVQPGEDYGAVRDRVGLVVANGVAGMIEDVEEVLGQMAEQRNAAIERGTTRR